MFRCADSGVHVVEEHRAGPHRRYRRTMQEAILMFGYARAIMPTGEGVP